MSGPELPRPARRTTRPVRTANAHPCILLVEDNPLNAELAQFVLSQAGMDVHLAGDGRTALAALRVCDPDVVLMDIQLPDLDGVEVARRMRDQAGSGVPCLVALTAFAMVGDRARLLASGFDGYLPKPIDVATFADSVRGFVRHGLPRRSGSR